MRCLSAGAVGALVRLVIATCSVDYKGRLGTHLPLAKRLIIFKGDGSISIHSESGYKPLNWMDGVLPNTARSRPGRR